MGAPCTTGAFSVGENGVQCCPVEESAEEAPLAVGAVVGATVGGVVGVCCLCCCLVAIGMREQRRKAAGAAGGGVELAAGGFAVGDIVTVHGLRATPQHNGRDGRVQRFVTADGRYDVRLLESGMLLAVKPTNLRRAGAVAAAQVRLEASAAGRGAVPTVSGTPVPPGRASLVSSIPIGLGKLRSSVPMGLPVSGGRRKSPPPAYSSGAAAAPPPAYSSGAAAAPPPAYGSGAAAASSSTPPGYATGLATGAPSATAPPVSVDTAAVDTTGDGRVSAVAHDTTGDGRHDTIAQQHGSDGPTTRAGAATAYSREYSAAETQTTREHMLEFLSL